MQFFFKFGHREPNHFGFFIRDCASDNRNAWRRIYRSVHLHDPRVKGLQYSAYLRWQLTFLWLIYAPCCCFRLDITALNVYRRNFGTPILHMQSSETLLSPFKLSLLPIWLSRRCYKYSIKFCCKQKFAIPAREITSIKFSIRRSRRDTATGFYENWS